MKRKATTTDAAAASAAAQQTKKKKPSPLLGKPQKFYVPDTKATSDMTREELSAWRKEERRKRNRASAAASRIKTQSKVAELEGQVSHWKSKCEDMQDMMMKLQRQVDMLTRSAQSPTAFEDGQALMAQQQQQQHNLVSPPSSHPNSPSSTSSSLLEPHPSMVTSSLDVKNFLAPPSLMLSPPSEDQTHSVESKADITSSQVDDSKKHINMISRQAVKTGANSLMNNMDSNIMPVLPNTCDRSMTEEDDDGVVVPTDNDCATPDVLSVEMLKSSSTVSSTSSLSSEEDVSSSETETRSMEEDDDLFDLLAETLDVNFDPDLLLL